MEKNDSTGGSIIRRLRYMVLQLRQLAVRGILGSFDWSLPGQLEGLQGMQRRGLGSSAFVSQSSSG